jgi:hypothetical protein
MTRKVAILISPPPSEGAVFQIAAICMALSKLDWMHWRPELYVFCDDVRVDSVISKWWPFRGEAVRTAPPDPSHPSYSPSHTDAPFRWRGSDAEVIVRLAPDILPVRNFEDVLEKFRDADRVGGVIAHYTFPAWPGLSPTEAWRRLSDGLLEKPLDPQYRYSLLGDKAPQGEKVTPFHANPGVVFFSSAIFSEIAERYLQLKPLLSARLPIRYFIDEIALSLAAARAGAETLSLPLRYNFPNDWTAEARFSEELEDVRIFHYFRTDEIGEDLFADELRYSKFIKSDFDGINRIFRAQVEAIIGARYPFGEICRDGFRTGSTDSGGESGRESPPASGAQSVTGCRHFDYAKGRPNLYLLMRFKQALLSELGVRRGFAVYQQTVSLPDSDRLVQRPLVGELAFAKTLPDGFFEIAPGGERFFLKPPTVIGEGNHQVLEGVTRTFYVACLNQARIRGRSALIESDDKALLDYQGSEPNLLDDEIEWDCSIFQADKDHAWIIAPEDRSSLELETAFTLLGAHTDFFGHWMCEYLPKIVSAFLSGVLPAVPVLIDADMPESHRQSLELLFPEIAELIEVPAFRAVSVRRLWCAPSLMYMPLHEKRNECFTWEAVAASPARFAPVIREMTRRADLANGAATGANRILLARRDFRHRRIVNRSVIQSAAEARGFKIIYPEDYGFAEQAAIIRNAQFIIAPEGSALFLMFFARGGTKLCILSHPLTDVLADYNGILSPHGIEITVLTGPFARLDPQTPHDSDYEIPESTFLSFIDKWLAGDVVS